AKAARRRAAPRISWSRRVGIAFALVLLGASAVLANQALDTSRRSTPSPAAEPSPSAVGPPTIPTLVALEKSIITTETTDVEVTLPDGLQPAGRYRLRIYVNGELARQRRLPRQSPAVVRDIPLEQGENEITAALKGPDGEGMHSAPLHVVRDDVVPILRVSSPASGAVVYTERVTLLGETEPGAAVTIANTVIGERQDVTPDEDGRFELAMGLAEGSNQLTLTSTDGAGNANSLTLHLRRVDGSASVNLSVRPTTLRLDDLPAVLNISARVRGLRGEPVDGAEVTFSISPPGQQTSTFQTTTRHGLASWRGYRVPRDGARRGQGLVTVMVVLPGSPTAGGRTLQESANFSFR
ncbi:MAG: hypothetical protein M3253_08840, partial [Chloroflexota bacterium]|nr:hypothetical protein [Chloroflexota bacterium]